MNRIRADRRIGLLLAGVVLLAFVALGATVALPATDASLDPSPKPAAMTDDQEHGMEVYRSEGCWYCHTQHIRQTRSDAALGAPLGPGAYDDRSPSMLGLERIGPDLSASTASADAIKEHGATGDLAYLSDAELEALAAYLAGRE
jgi:cbb3-type cytochrome oxidase cytochrome c subunit